MPHPMRIALLLVVSLSAQGADTTLDIWRGKGLDEPKIRYLDVGGWLLHWQNEGLLIAPLFSNPALFDHPGLPPLVVEADPARIDKYMPSASDVTLLLVGHGHYDHLLDVP